MRVWFNNCPYDRFALHDPVAVLLAFEPETANWVKSGVRVLRGGESEGITVLSQNDPVCNVAIGIDNPEDAAQRIFSLIFNV